MPKNTLQLNKWTEKFGEDYTKRNPLSLNGLENLYKRNLGITRTELNKMFLGKIGHSSRILEIGSNTGNQLLCLQKMGFSCLYGLEPQNYAVELSKKKSENINIIKGDAFDVPFKDNYFDLVFTSGVLIHIFPQDIKEALCEIYRCTKKYIWGYEYYSEECQEIIYRGRKNLLWKANFPKIYTDIFPTLKIVKVEFFKYLESDNVDVMFLLEKNEKKR